MLNGKRKNHKTFTAEVGKLEIKFKKKKEEETKEFRTKKKKTHSSLGTLHTQFGAKLVKRAEKKKRKGRKKKKQKTIFRQYRMS